MFPLVRYVVIIVGAVVGDVVIPGDVALAIVGASVFLVTAAGGASVGGTSIIVVVTVLTAVGGPPAAGYLPTPVR